MLRKHCQVSVFAPIFFDDAGTETLDSVFPNNWFSTHAGGHVALYPMFAPSRRKERRADVIEMLKNQYRVQDMVDYAGLEPRYCSARTEKSNVSLIDQFQEFTEFIFIHAHDMFVLWKRTLSHVINEFAKGSDAFLLQPVKLSRKVAIDLGMTRRVSSIGAENIFSKKILGITARPRPH